MKMSPRTNFHYCFGFSCSSPMRLWNVHAFFSIRELAALELRLALGSSQDPAFARYCSVMASFTSFRFQVFLLIDLFSPYAHNYPYHDALYNPFCLFHPYTLTSFYHSYHSYYSYHSDPDTYHYFRTYFSYSPWIYMNQTFTYYDSYISNFSFIFYLTQISHQMMRKETQIANCTFSI